MVECTLFMTHCLWLNLQLYTISLVRTCRISSFCTVAWQLARLLLTKCITQSLGDSWASCFSRRVSCSFSVNKLEINSRRARGVVIIVNNLNVSAVKNFVIFFRARRYASASTGCGPVSVYLCLCVCQSQVGVLLKRLDGPSWFFWHGGFFRPVCHYVIKKFRHVQNKDTFLWNFFQGLRKFRHGISIVETTKLDSHCVINWTVVGQLHLQ